MLVLQILAVGLIVFAVVVLVQRVIIGRDVAFTVFFVQALAIPGAGVVAFFFNPSNTERLLPFAVAGALLVGMGALVWAGVVQHLVPGSVWTSETSRRTASRNLLARTCWVLGTTSYVFALEPAFALANVAANLVWVALWVPPWLRRMTGENSIQIDASPSAVWTVMTEPTRYSPRDVNVTLAPPGRLHRGTTISTVRTTPLAKPWRGMTEVQVRTESQIVEFSEGVSYTAVATDQRSTTTRTVEPAGNGSVARMRSRFVASITDGITGRALESRLAMRRYSDTANASLGRLRDTVMAATLAPDSGSAG